MKRNEIISKLSNIDICVANITYTYDIGILFDVIISKGVLSEHGYNYSQWPCFKFNVSEDSIILINRLKNGENIGNDELLKNIIFREISTFHGYHESFLLGDEVLGTCIKLIRDEIIRLDCSSGSFYAYISLENCEIIIKFFSNYQDMEIYFKDECCHLSCRFWDDMSDKELEEWYHVAEENDWGGVPYMEIRDDEEDCP